MKYVKLIALMAFVATLVSCSGRQDEFNKYVAPIASNSIQQKLEYGGSFEDAKGIVLQACKFYETSSKQYGRDYIEFGDKECLERMVDVYPHLEKYLLD